MNVESLKSDSEPVFGILRPGLCSVLKVQITKSCFSLNIWFHWFCIKENNTKTKDGQVLSDVDHVPFFRGHPVIGYIFTTGVGTLAQTCVPIY